ncbi:2,3-diaminopropionate biosynthesis protein SbnA [Pandoraea commovens]|uniref:2,3-diaminopropionate biosynthesis protein SbnA n=1 Tax=Pandoraea commovens TaxID=2508289 RepID=A0A5E4UHP4_9BURK|nr:2,3-diaminopropionate biosynthesis protein SbnA [Pandoraea commovens]VVD99566.1 2,3-diaminopropionate biosynthesis protein SbnA [Pandoraea commovens]
MDFQHEALSVRQDVERAPCERSRHAGASTALRIDGEFLRPTVPVFTTIEGLCAAAVHLKLEGFNAAGSVKLKTALQLIEDLEIAHPIRPDTQIVESSSGNLGVALAMVCANRGYRFTCVTDPNTSRQAIRAMQAVGARVVRVDRRDAQGGYLATRIAWIREQVARDPRCIWVNQYANPANWRAHFRWTAPEIFSAYPDVDHLFIGAGTTGTLMGCLHYVRAHRLRTRVVAVDAVGSVTFGGPPGPRFIPGLGTSCKPPLSELSDSEPPDAIVHVCESDTLRMCHTLARRGLLAGGSTGSVLHAVQASTADIAASDTVVAIAPDMGDKYLDTLYDGDWAAACFGDTSGISGVSGAPDISDVSGTTAASIEIVAPSLS